MKVLLLCLILLMTPIGAVAEETLFKVGVTTHEFIPPERTIGAAPRATCLAP
jgi:hypothetical protein